MDNDKLNQIEETIAHQEQQIQDLSDMVVRQSDGIEALKKQLLKMQSKIDVIESDGFSGAESVVDQRPPHY